MFKTLSLDEQIEVMTQSATTKTKNVTFEREAKEPRRVEEIQLKAEAKHQSIEEEHNREARD